MTVPAGLADATVRGALRVGLGNAALAGIVSAEAIALMKGVSQTMTTTKLIALTASVLTACLVTTGVGLMAYPGQQAGVRRRLRRRRASRPGPVEANAGRSPDDQLDALLRQYDETSEAMRKTITPGELVPQLDKASQAFVITSKAKGEMIDAETKARRQANVGTLQGIQGQLLELAIRYPRTNAAEQALIWLVTHNAFSPESTRAYERLARDHARSDRIKQVVNRQLEIHWASRAVEDLLRNTLEQNPYRETRGLACYWLAEVLKHRAEILRLRPLQPPRLAEMWRQRFSPQDLDRVAGQDPKALEEEAARLYERVIAEFPLVANNDSRTVPMPLILGRAAPQLPAVAKVHLDELRRLAAGKPAPEIEGVDLDGKLMKLSDFRGKVVVLSLPGFGVPFARQPGQAAALHVAVLRRLAPTIEGKPVALLGVVESHREEHKKAVQASGLPVRFWWDPPQEGQPEFAGQGWSPRPGPILTAWDAENPNVYVIDANGVIRYIYAFGPDILEKAVATVLKEQENGSDRIKKPGDE